MKRVARIRVERWKKTGNPQKGRHNYWCVGRLSPVFRSKKKYKHIKYGKSILRSSYEYAFAKWCRKNKVRYRYEPKTFRLKPGLGKSFTYTPDFYLPDFDLWVEISPYTPKEK